MSAATLSSRASPGGPLPVALGPSPQEIDASCRAPLLAIFLSAAVWAVVGSALGLMASIKFHSPDFLADPAWLTYGRIQPAGTNAIVYGFGMQGCLGLALWLLARLGQTRLRVPVVTLTGVVFWNLGLTIGVSGILCGDSTGFALLEMPLYSAGPLFLGYLLLAVPAVLLVRSRRQQTLFVSQWFLLAALFWFPWIYSSAELLLTVFPVRGVAQSVVAWWYAQNLVAVWFGLVGLGMAFYFIPKLSGRDLHSRYLSLLVFWMLVVVGSWAGIPRTAPVPAWMPAVSTVSMGLMAVPLIAVALNLYRTLAAGGAASAGGPALGFVGGGALAFLVYWLMSLAEAWPYSTGLLHLTWFAAARLQLCLFGFVGLILYGAVYYVSPRVASPQCLRARPIRLHLWLALLGVLLIFVPLALAGLVESARMQDAKIPFTGVAAATLPFLRVSTIGSLLVMTGNVLFLANLVGLSVRLYRAQLTEAYVAATALSPVEARA